MADPVKTAFCPRFHRAAELVGRKWTGAIVRALLNGITRFNDLAEAVPGLSPRLLTARLRELEAEEIVVREIAADSPLRVRYSLTYKGRALAKVVDAITEWAHDWTEALPGDPADLGHPTHPKKAARR